MTCPGAICGVGRKEAIFNCVDMIKMIAAYRAERGESPVLNEAISVLARRANDQGRSR